MKNIKTSIINWTIMAFSFFITLSLTYITYWYVSWLWWKINGNSLTSSDWNSLVANVDEVKSSTTIPTWFVGSFNLATCPTWWTEYTLARWRFIRWIDSTWTNDGIRAAGNTQEDAFQWHWHMSWSPNTYPRTSWTYWTAADNSSWEWATWYGARRIVSDTVNWTPRIAPETRPKNVALLFCQKN